MNPYDHLGIEKYWKDKWEKDSLYKTNTHSNKPTFYGLVEFPYPSGAGLHVGHVRSYTGMDVIVRKRRMEHFETLFPIGWDAFGLPAENYAIKTGIHPSISTRENINTFREQLKSCGFSFDWEREVDTTDPNYYKWTQWIFLKLYEKGLAYKKEMPVNWCPKDKCVLANEEVVDGKCERCGTQAEKRNKEQWMLAITKYAERLDKDLDETEFLERIKIQQRNWIGLSEGSEINFKIKTENSEEKKKILIGTRNNAKFKMLTACFPKDLNIEFINLNDIEVDDSSLVEGQDFEDNAKRKSEFYFKATGIPTISTDHILWLEKWPKDKGYMIHLRKEANPISERATDDEVVTFLKNLVKENGESKAHFEYAVSFADENGTKGFVSFQREYILQDTQSEKFWEGYPTESLLIDVETGEYKGDQKDDFRYAGLIKDLDRETRKWFNSSFTVYTTRADTLFGCTYCVLAPEHVLVKNLLSNGKIKNKEEVQKYIEEAVQKIDIDRSATGKEKTGVKLEGISAINPANLKEIPVYIADYVLATYGTGAIMAVPAHDERDEEFAKKYGIEIKQVINSCDGLSTGDGFLINSENFNGLKSEIARTKITEAVSGRLVKKSKLRDWVFARQRYWGEPIPLVYDKAGKMYPVSEKELPITLPKVEKYEPTDNGESPLSQVTDWVNVKGKIDENGCFYTDENGEEFHRETDTMPQWAGSSWYFMRYIDPKNEKSIGDKDMLMKWLPVNWYNGGMEHTTLHLLYSRFWYKFLFDIGLTPTSEPYFKRTSQGMILGGGGVKMSKSLGNIVNPDEIVKKFGADTLRMYEMFIGPFDQAVAWDDKSVIGIRRFIERVYALKFKIKDVEKTLSITHKTIKKIGEDIESMAFNTAMSSLMICLNEYEKEEFVSKNDYQIFIKLLAPFAPFITEELWKYCGNDTSIHIGDWPKYDDSKLVNENTTYVLQVNGKWRGEVFLPVTATKEEVLKAVKALDGYIKYVGENLPKKEIFVPGKLINIVI